MFFKSKRQKNDDFNKKLYNTQIMQGIFDRLEVIENRLEELKQKEKMREELK
jgi:hypothetical protein